MAAAPYPPLTYSDSSDSDDSSSVSETHPQSPVIAAPLAPPRRIPSASPPTRALAATVPISASTTLSAEMAKAKAVAAAKARLAQAASKDEPEEDGETDPPVVSSVPHGKKRARSRSPSRSPSRSRSRSPSRSLSPRKPSRAELARAAATAPRHPRKHEQVKEEEEEEEDEDDEAPSRPVHAGVTPSKSKSQPPAAAESDMESTRSGPTAAARRGGGHHSNKPFFATRNVRPDPSGSTLPAFKEIFLLGTEPYMILSEIPHNLVRVPSEKKPGGKANYVKWESIQVDAKNKDLIFFLAASNRPLPADMEDEALAPYAGYTPATLILQNMVAPKDMPLKWFESFVFTTDHKIAHVSATGGEKIARQYIPDKNSYIRSAEFRDNFVHHPGGQPWFSTRIPVSAWERWNKQEREGTVSGAESGTATNGKSSKSNSNKRARGVQDTDVSTAAAAAAATGESASAPTRQKMASLRKERLQNALAGIRSTITNISVPRTQARLDRENAKRTPKERKTIVEECAHLYGTFFRDITTHEKLTSHVDALIRNIMNKTIAGGGEQKKAPSFKKEAQEIILRVICFADPSAQEAVKETIQGLQTTEEDSGEPPMQEDNGLNDI